MDRRRFLQTTAVVATGTALAGCLADRPSPDIFVAGTRGASSVDNASLRTWLADADVGELSPTERADVFWMREEEKLARDIYIQMADAWGLQVHENIVDSEQSHMDAMFQLVEIYDLEDPATDTVGTFTNEDLQALHDDLIEWGAESALDSLKVGCRIEETDIRDIQVRLDRTDEAVIQLVYENLLRGSRNHLRAFYRNLTRRGGDYEPVIISQEEFDEIASGDWETGKE